MAEFTPQQINKIMEFATLTLQRQKFAPEKGELGETGMKSLSEFENHIKDMNDVTGRLYRGFKDLLKMPRSVEEAFNDIEKIIHNSTSKYADDINKLSKASLAAIRTHGANSDAIKNQTKGVLTSIHALKDFRENAITLNKLLEEKSKLSTRKGELDVRGSAATTSEKKELVEIEKALTAITEAYKAQKTQISEELDNVSKGIAMMPDGMRQAMIDVGFAEAVMQMKIDLGQKNAKLSNEQIEMAGKQLNVLQQLSQTMSVTFSQIKEYVKEVQSQGKAMALAAGAMAIATGKNINDAVLSRLGANLAENNFITASRMGLSPSELNSVAKTNASELGMFSGTYNPGDAFDDSALMVQLQDTARKMGLVGVEGTKMVLETFNFQRRSGSYDKNQTPQQRIQSADSFLKAMKSGAYELQMPLEEYTAEIKGLLESGYLNPFIDTLSKNLTGDERDAAILEHTKVVKGNIRQLGYNNDYLKKTLDMQRSATATGLEKMIRDQIGVEMGSAALDQYLPGGLSARDKEIINVVQKGNLKGLSTTDQERYQEILAGVKKKSLGIVGNMKVDGTPQEKAKANAAYTEMATFNMLKDIIQIDALSEDAMFTQYNAKIAADTNKKNTDADGSSPVRSKSEQALEDIIAPLNNFEENLLDVEQKIRGAFSSPIGAPIGTALGWAGTQIATTAGTLWAANKMGLMAPAAPAAAGGGGKMAKAMSMAKGGGKLAILGGLAYGVYSLLSSDGGGSGGAGGAGSLGPNGEISNATFSIQSAILNIGNGTQTIGTGAELPVAAVTTASAGESAGNFSDKAILGTGAAALGSSLLPTVAGKGLFGALAKKLPGPLGGLFTGMYTYNELGEDSSVGRAERTGGAIGSALGSAGGWWAGATAGAAIGTPMGGTTLNPVVAGALGVAGGLAGAYFGEAAVQEVGEEVGSAFDYMTDSTAELFWQMDKFAENFGIGVQADPEAANSMIQWIDENSNASGLPSTILAAQEQKMSQAEKDKEDAEKKIDPEVVKQFMDKISGVMDILGNFLPWWKTAETQKQLETRTDKEIAASFEQQVKDANAMAFSKVTKNIGRASESPFK